MQTIKILETTIDRKTGEVIKKTILETEERINTDELYLPLIEVLYKDFKKWEKTQNNY